MKASIFYKKGHFNESVEVKMELDNELADKNAELESLSLNFSARMEFSFTLYTKGSNRYFQKYSCFKFEEFFLDHFNSHDK